MFLQLHSVGSLRLTTAKQKLIARAKRADPRRFTLGGDTKDLQKQLQAAAKLNADATAAADDAGAKKIMAPASNRHRLRNWWNHKILGKSTPDLTA